uniref:Protein artemis n=1 Tax=Clastoptera arizonana TaxID=38151 RepID=A0A1B6CUL4_9HEMI
MIKINVSKLLCNVLLYAYVLLYRFLFESPDVTVLYTGDFRLPFCDLPKYKALHTINGKVKKIDAIYLDTTFAFPKYLQFPSREKSKNELVNIVNQWLNKNPNNQIAIIPTACYGLEFLLLELAKAIMKKLYIPSSILFENYSYIPEFSDLITSDSDSTNVHLCEYTRNKPHYCKLCFDKKHVFKRIRPSAMIFDQEHLNRPQLNEGIVDYSDPDIIKLAYSTHCSLQELKDFLKYISQDGCKIYPSVLPPQYNEKQILDNLETLSLHSETERNKEQETSDRDCVNYSSELQSSNDFEPTNKQSQSTMDFDNLIAPPRPRKFSRKN